MVTPSAWLFLSTSTDPATESGKQLNFQLSPFLFSPHAINNSWSLITLCSRNRTCVITPALPQHNASPDILTGKSDTANKRIAVAPAFCNCRIISLALVANYLYYDNCYHCIFLLFIFFTLDSQSKNLVRWYLWHRDKRQSRGLDYWNRSGLWISLFWNLWERERLWERRERKRKRMGRERVRERMVSIHSIWNTQYEQPTTVY